MNSMSVKQERCDDAEIQALADKIREASKARMVITQKPHHPPLNPGMLNTMESLTNNRQQQHNNSSKNSSNSMQQLQQMNCRGGNEPATSGGKVVVDEDSISGRFGWDTIGKNPIPYINRSGEKYCAVRMVEMKVLNKYLNFLHQDIYNCTCIRSYYITESEGRLLNEINFKHCDYQFGRELFTTCDLIVRLSDAIEFYHFLGSCYTKLVSGETDSLGRCGFIRINKESVVPYTVYNDQKYVPLFYFEGETDNLKQRANKLEGWDLSYLKFCCKVQGIRNELFAHDSCSVISLNDIKNYFPPGTSFEDYWPKKNVDSQLLISGSARNQTQIIQWTRQPSGPPITPTRPSQQPPALRALPPVDKSHLRSQMCHNSFPLFGLQHQQSSQHHYQQPRNTTTSAVRSTYHSPVNNMHLRSNYYSSIGQAPPPLQPSPTQPAILYASSQPTVNLNPNNNFMVLEQNLNQTNYHQGASDIHDYPLMDIRHLNGILPTIYESPSQTQRYGGGAGGGGGGGGAMDAVNLSTAQCELQSSYNVNNNSQSQIINQQPAHQQQTTRTQAASVASGIIDDEHNNSNITNGQQQPLGNLCLENLHCQLTPIPDTPTSGNHIPYKMQKALVVGKMIPCINMKPYVYAELLVTLADLNLNFFNDIPVQPCQRVMKVLDIELYKPNSSQMQVLMESGKCRNLNEIVPLVQVRNVIDFMPQLKYMLGGVISNTLSNKRQRNS